MKRVLIIQTAFIGDVILATALVEKLSDEGGYDVDMLVRKGNESLVQNHPHLKSVFVWEKQSKKYRSLMTIIGSIRREKYDYVINLQRFFSTGLMTALSGATVKIGFRKNPLSFLFSHSAEHVLDGVHEVDRNIKLLSYLGVTGTSKPKLYPSILDFEAVHNFKKSKFICIAPSSVWYTKQWPADKWIDLINSIENKTIYLLGAPSDVGFNDSIIKKCNPEIVHNLAGKLTLLQSAALMKDATMNYVNDSAPLHLASSMNAPVRAIFCSTVPRFGFGPLSDDGKVVQVAEKLSCRPCGLHGYKACPKKHFKCAKNIEIKAVLES